jgi:hypothetical protein
MDFLSEKTFIVDFRLRVASTDFSEFFMAGWFSVLGCFNQSLSDKLNSCSAWIISQQNLLYV